MTKWEYDVIHLPACHDHGDAAQMKRRLTELGLLGWELITIYNHYGIFKRLLVNAEEEPGA